LAALRRALVAGAIAAGLVGDAPARAAVLHVPAEHPTASQALALAAPGDTVLLSPGIYPENLSLPSGVTLRGAGPPEAVVLDAGGLGPGVVCGMGAAGTRVESITVRQGLGGPAGGGGVRVTGGSLALADVRFESCVAAFGAAVSCAGNAQVTWNGGSATGGQASFGGALFADGGSLALDHVTLSGNQGTKGGALYAQDTSPLSLVSCTIQDNVSVGDGGALYLVRTGTSISDCGIRGNRAGGNGGGLAAEPGTQVVCGYSVLFANEGLAGGGLYAICDGPGGGACTLVQLTHVDLVRNRGGGSGAAGIDGSARLEATASVVAFNEGGIACLDPRATIDLRCTLLHGNGAASGFGCSASMTDTTTADPRLCGVATGNLERCADSPALTSACGPPFLGALGVGCATCGITASTPLTWGSLKARYR